MKKGKYLKRQWWMWYAIGAVVLITACVLIVLLLTASSGGNTGTPAANAAPGAAIGSNGSPVVNQPEGSDPMDDANQSEETEIQPEDGHTHPTEGDEPEADLSIPAKLYWNVDRLLYTDGSQPSTRKPDENGNYKIRFAFDGRLVEKVISNKKLVDFIDTLDVMALETDSQGIVTEVIGTWDAVAELAKNVCVVSATANALVISTGTDKSGITLEFVLGQETGIYDVSPDAQTPGVALQPSELKQGDILEIYGDFNDNVTYVYVIHHAEA